MKNNQFDFSGHIKHVEDAQAVELPEGDSPTLTDSELEGAGLVKTSAYVRTRRSKNALHVEKRRAKQAEQGIKQLNIEVPDEHAEAVKHFAKRLREGALPENAFKTPTEPTSPKPTQPSGQDTEKPQAADYEPCVADYGRRVAEIKRAGGFRSLLLRMAGV
jgi:hypothetical protein